MSDILHFLDEKEIDPANISENNVSILSAPLANTVSWGKGTDKGPTAILEASKALELFDEELLAEPYKIGIETIAPLSFDGMDSTTACDLIRHAVTSELKRNRFPVILGGEHTVTLPAVEACLTKYKDLHVLQIDAHLDLRDSYLDDPLSHACVMRRLHDLGVSFTQVGIRSCSKEEWQFVQDKGLKPFTMQKIKNNSDWIKKVCDTIHSPIYITFDIDGLDPSVIPATGTPEPGGLSWHDATSLLKEITAQNKIVGMDFVELAPTPDLHHAAYTVAKLIYRTIGYIFKDSIK